MSSNGKRLWNELKDALRKRGKEGYLGKLTYAVEYGKLLRKDKLRQRRDAMLRSGCLTEEESNKVTEILFSEDESNWEIANYIMEFKKQEAKERRLARHVKIN